MALLVQKFGGTSVGTTDRISAVADKVCKFRKEGHDVVVVVSAMSGETNRLIGLASEIMEEPVPREMDVLVSTGEQVTIALLSMALQKRQCEARSYTGSQVRIVTDSTHTKARIKQIDEQRMREDLDAGRVVVVAGFQGIDANGDITTLGRGGSDTTAVAIAWGINADVCEIYSDVDGVYTTDPRIERKARKLDRISFEEMLELASLGAKVLQTRSVELAMNHKVKLMVRSSFSDDPGTLVCPEEDIVEKNVVSGIAAERGQAKVTLLSVADKPGVAASIFGPLAEGGVNVDMIVQNISEEGLTDMTFSCGQEDVEKAKACLEKAKADIGYRDIVVDDDVAKVSVVGIGMRSHSGVAQKMFSALAADGVNIKVITTSEIKVSVLIDRKYMELAVQSLHGAFGLDAA